MRLLDSKDFDNMQVKIYDMQFHNRDKEARHLTISNIAPICYGKEYASNPKQIVETLYKNGHFTPFEFVRGNPPTLENSWRHNPDLPYSIAENYYIFRLVIPMFIKNQIIRHRGFSYMEISRRFTKPSIEDFYIKPPLTTDYVYSCLEKYNNYIENNVKPELARLVLPAYALNCTLFMAGTVEQYKDFVIKRLCDNSQAETKEVVKTMGELLRIYCIK